MFQKNKIILPIKIDNMHSATAVIYNHRKEIRIFTPWVSIGINVWKHCYDLSNIHRIQFTMNYHFQTANNGILSIIQMKFQSITKNMTVVAFVVCMQITYKMIVT